VRPYFLILLVVAFFAGNALTGKALNDLPALTIALARFGIAFLLLLPLGWREAWQARGTFASNPGPVLLLAVTGVGGFNTLIYVALQDTTATNVAVLQTAVPSLTALLGWLLLRERLSPLQCVGVVLSMVGAAWVVTEGELLGFLGQGGWNVGDTTTLVAVGLWAGYSVAVRRYAGRFPDYGLVLVLTGVSLLVVLPLAVGQWVLEGVPALGAGPHWWGLVYVGVFPSVVALLLYNRSVTELGPSQAAVFLSLLPVFTMVGAAIFLGERVGPVHVVGTVVVILGVVLTTRRAASPEGQVRG
jgi:drug/metabolite transporter (DMT)-like permease